MALSISAAAAHSVMRRALAALAGLNVDPDEQNTADYGSKS